MYTTREEISVAKANSLSVGYGWLPGLGDLRVRGERSELVDEGAAGVGTGKPCISIRSTDKFCLTLITLFHIKSPCVVLVFDSSTVG